MQSNVWLAAALWMGMALVAGVVSIRIGVSVALIEIVVGIVAGNFFGVEVAPWVTTVIGSAIVPTVIAQRFFQPALPAIERTEEDVEVIVPAS